MGTRQSFRYFLPRTVVRFSGRRVETVDQFAAGPVVDIDAEVECVEQADPEWPLGIAINDTFLRDREGSIGFTTDRRLTSLSASSTGTAGTFAAGAIRFVTSTASAIVAGILEVAGVSAEEQYTVECPEAAANRNELRAAVVATRQAIVAAATSAPQTLCDLLAAMKALTALQAEAETHFTAWRESKKAICTQDLAFEVPVLSLPHGLPDDLTPETLGACWEPFDKLGVLAVVEGDPPAPTRDLAPNTVASGFYFRSPRPVWLRIYERTGADTARLLERRRQLVHDAHCATEFVSCESGAWSKKSVSAELDAGSALSKITTG